MEDRCGFLFVRYKKHCCIDLVSWEHAACPLSGIKKRLLVGGWLNTSSVVISIGATPSVLYREVVRSWEGGSTVLVTALVGRDKSAILSNYASQEWHNMVAEVFIIYAPVPFSVQCSPRAFVLSYRELAVILWLHAKAKDLAMSRPR